ncbi:hypothetical protein AAZX31_15G199500 [Glycine max]|uniref:uncharacterized protein n=1 Tax=Glycine max TaxID=3847 RepID=UPI0003DE95A2|nr:uncharacterized protein LOC102660823 [Glycine max]|eukprot:XP_006597980.1 uncharacterized protein LOC102660823 [Glycine max]
MANTEHAADASPAEKATSSSTTRTCAPSCQFRTLARRERKLRFIEEEFIRAGFAVVTLERVVGIGSDEEGVGFGASETFDVVFYLRRVVRHNGWTNREVW